MSKAVTPKLSFLESLAQLRDKRFLAIFLFGFCSGFPWVLHGSVLTLWMQQSGLSRSMIGYVGAIATVYAINWTWAPLVDRLKIPYLHEKLGQRRSWIMLGQLLLAVFVLALSFADPRTNLPLVSLLALGIALVSATLDISIDAYRITVFKPDEMDSKMPFAAAMSTVGWFAGYGFIGGAIALALGGETIGLSWSEVYRVVAVFYFVIMGLVLLTPIPEDESVVATSRRSSDTDSLPLVNRIYGFVLEPFVEFFRRCGFKLALSILLFLVVFRLGEAMLGRMSLVFYVELGFTTDQISFYQKFFGGLMTAGFSLLGAVINTRYGVIKGLFVAGVAMAAANLLFALLAVIGPNVGLFMVTLLVDNFFQAFSTVAAISFISYFTSRTHTGTQYAMMSSISNFGKTTLAAGSGAIVDFLNGEWAIFFVLTTLMVIPGLCLLVWVGRLLKTYTGSDENYARL
ncbi:MAG: PAT family beta-lactamase induction signal transducer AmpG [Pseudohongiellaceae bacterium]|jgi:PAT family beta-lactamase induction signal transducer AmpG